MAKGRKTTQYESIDQIDLQNDLFEVVDHSETVKAKKNKKGTFSQVAEALEISVSGSVTNFQNIGEGEGEVYSHTSGSVGLLRTLKAGENVEIETNGDEIIITNTGGIPSGSVIPTGSIVTLRNFKLNEDMEVEDLVVLMSNGNIRKIEYVTAGDTLSYTSDLLGRTFITTLTENTHIISYIQGVSTLYMRILRVDVDTLSVTLSDPVLVAYNNSATSQAGSPNGYRIDDTSFIFVFATNDQRDPKVVPHGWYGRVCTIAGNTINMGSTYTLGLTGGASVGGSYTISHLDTDYFIFARNSKARIIKVVGNSIDTYTEATLFASLTFYRPLVLYSTKFLTYGTVDSGVAQKGAFQVCYRDSVTNLISTGSVQYYGEGQQITTATALMFNSDEGLIYYNSNVTNLRYLQPFTVSASNVSFLDFNETFSSAASLFMVWSDKRFFINTNQAYQGIVGEAAIEFIGDPYTYPFTFSSGKILNENLIIFTGATGTGTIGIVFIGPLGGYAIIDKIRGVLQQGGNTNEYRPVALFADVSTVHSSLIPGREYYYNTTTKKGVTTQNTGFFTGPAYSSTDLKIVTY